MDCIVAITVRLMVNVRVCHYWNVALQMVGTCDVLGCCDMGVDSCIEA